MTKKKDGNARIAKNTIYLTIRMLFVMLVSLYSSRVFLRVLGVEDYGINNVVSGLVSMLAFIRASLSNATQRFYNYEIGANGESSVSAVYTASLHIQIIIGIVIVVLLETVGLWYLNNKMVIPEERFSIAFWLYQFSVVSCFVTIVQIPYFAAVMAYERMGFYALISIIDVVLKLFFAFLIPYVPIDKLLSLGLFTMGVTVLVFLLNFVYCKKYFHEIRITQDRNPQLFKKMLSFAGWNAFGSFSITFREQGLNMILNLFYGPVMNAARSISYQVTGAVHNFVQTISVAARPQIMQSYASGQQERSVNLMYSISKLSYVLMFLLALPISLEVNYILSLWLGDIVPDYSGAFIRVVLLTTLMNTLTAQISTMVHATGKMRRYQVITGLFCLLVLPFSYLYLKYYENPVGVFVIMLIVITINYFISLLILKTLMPFSVRDYFKSIIIPLFLSSVVSVIIPYLVHLQMGEGFIRLIVVLMVSTVSIIVSFFLLGLTKNERSNVLLLLKQKQQ